MRRSAQIVLLACLPALASAAFAFDNGQYEHVPPDIRAWFKGVIAPNGVPCCDISDGHRTEYDVRVNDDAHLLRSRRQETMLVFLPPVGLRVLSEAHSLVLGERAPSDERGEAEGPKDSLDLLDLHFTAGNGDTDLFLVRFNGDHVPSVVTLGAMRNAALPELRAS